MARLQERCLADRESSRRFVVAELASQARDGVLAYLSLPNSLNWICKEFGSSKLGIWKEALQSMLSGLSFQQGLLRAAKEVVAQDVTKPFIMLKTRGSRGVSCSPGNHSCIPSGDLRINFGTQASSIVDSASTGSGNVQSPGR